MYIGYLTYLKWKILSFLSKDICMIIEKFFDEEYLIESTIKEDYPLIFKIEEPSDTFKKRFGDGSDLPKKLNHLVATIFSTNIRSKVLNSLKKLKTTVTITSGPKVAMVGGRTIGRNQIFLSMDTPLPNIGDYLVHEIIHILTINNIVNFKSLANQVNGIVKNGLKPGATLKKFLIGKHGYGGADINRREEPIAYFGNASMDFSLLKKEASEKLKALLFSGNVFNISTFKRVIQRLTNLQPMML